jgi:FkbM family methyltransferase
VIELDELLGGPFDSVLDVGGNVGEFAEAARTLWPAARITSFEPLADVYRTNCLRANGRWTVEPYAISDRRGVAVLNRCENQHSASSLQPVGGVRAELGIRFAGLAGAFASPLGEVLQFDAVYRRP